MVIVGIDTHKRTHTAVAIEASGQKLDQITVPATTAGALTLLDWAARWAERRWAIEDCRHLSRRLEGDLLRAGESVVRVYPKLMAGARRIGREPGKSDPIDALAVARAALREPDLPIARLDGPERDIRLLTDHRDDLVATRTAMENRLRWHLHELWPGQEPPARSLARASVLAAVDDLLAGSGSTGAGIARELVALIRTLTSAIERLEREIRALVAPLAPTLLLLEGCGWLGAAKLIGETAGITRFRSRAAYARHNGSAPVPVWSGNVVRHRLNRGGNRQINLALHRIAITQLRVGAEGRTYFEHRLAVGDTRTEALRALRRRISDEVYRRLRHDESRRAASHEVADLAA